MKSLKRIGLTFLFLLVLGSVGGCFYFKAKFKPAANQLKVVPQSVSIPVTWAASGQDPYAYLLVPVTLAGCPKTFYLQFDTGAPSTLFYKGKMEAIQKKGFALTFGQTDDRLQLKEMTFTVGALPVTAQEVTVLAYGDSVIHWNDPSSIEVIGTLGTDFLEGHIVELDYQRMTLTLSDQLPNNLAPASLQPFTFDSRRILLPSRINGDETELLFDSGSSTYELLTDKATFESFAQPGQTQDAAQVNSWGKTLTAYTTTTNATVAFGPVQLPLRKATYLEGMSFMNTILMRFSGMGGMTGNKLFLGHTLLLDLKQMRFAVLN
ncbi:hypothetical protein [Rufibacter aurantiacus]|uniref:hypothetical protein n=1 Tax=Rufibacter aurantiacus TaxID=2817374 RepID=UPI001B3125A2|nr:hypothetical protein [Rufibacter aurantiacus]